jgi:hypothetical protein
LEKDAQRNVKTVDEKLIFISRTAIKQSSAKQTEPRPFSRIGNSPALPEDSKRLTVPGIARMRQTLREVYS